MGTDFPDRLRDAGLRVTRPRVAVLAALAAHPHADAATVHQAVEALVGRASRQAVYDVLDALTEADLVRRVGAVAGPARFELRVDEHDHLACRDCGSIVDVPRAASTAPQSPTHTHGYTVHETEVVHWGTCPGCAAAG